ncbi:MAG: alpha/beta fold hydrolase [Omnitrophica WOR_2 bacterium]
MHYPMLRTTPKSLIRKIKTRWAVLAGLVAGFFLLFMPIRSRQLRKYYTQFRSAFRPMAEAIDARFNHQDRIVNGIRWHYVDDGPRQGKVILFLHGLPEGWYSWRYVLPLVDPQFRRIAVDMKGYGRSDKVDDDYNWHTVADQTLALMDSLGVGKFYVVGHDWGALIGSILVNDHPDRILGFIRMQADLLPEEPGYPLHTYLHKPQWALFQFPWIATYLMEDAGWFIDYVFQTRRAAPLKQLDRDYLVYELARPQVAQQVPRYFTRSNWDLDAALENICKKHFPFPILILQADHDPYQPVSNFSRVAVECPHVELKWIANASHFTSMDQPEQVAGEINRFLHAAV